MRTFTSIVLLAVLMGFSAPANSALIDRGTGMIYDSDQGITWLQDANYAQTSGYDDDGIMTWTEATNWVHNLTYGGVTDWRLPRTDSTTGDSIGWVNEGEMAHLYYEKGITYTSPGPFLNLIGNQYWTESHYEGSLDTKWDFDFSRGRQGLTYKESSINHSWAVRDGDYGPSVSTTQTYLTDYLILGDTFSFDYWWEMGTEPTEFNMDALFFNGTNWETLGWQLNFDGSSDQWNTASFWVPEWARGTEAQIMFRVLDLGQETDPTVYLRNIGSSSAAPVPEPATIFLLGTGLFGVLGASRKKFKKS